MNRKHEVYMFFSMIFLGISVGVLIWDISNGGGTSWEFWGLLIVGNLFTLLANIESRQRKKRMLDALHEHLSDQSTQLRNLLDEMTTAAPVKRRNSESGRRS